MFVVCFVFAFVFFSLIWGCVFVCFSFGVLYVISCVVFVFILRVFGPSLLLFVVLVILSGCVFCLFLGLVVCFTGLVVVLGGCVPRGFLFFSGFVVCCLLWV